MSRKKYDDNADKTLSYLISESSNMTDDDIIIALSNAIEKLGVDYASIR